MEWTEVAVDSTTGLGSNCGRSGHSHDKRARIIALQNEVVTKNLTSTLTVTETATDTVTFSVTVRQMMKIIKLQNSYLFLLQLDPTACTTSGFTFAVELCTAASTGK